MNIEEAIKSAMAKMLERECTLTNVTVTSWEEEFDVYRFGGCDTCGPEYEKEYAVIISYYVDYPEGRVSTYYTYKGTFTDLIKELDA
jgi:hypothetical protein